jgi:hypothetical protein
MTPKDRFELISDYPGNYLKVGTILTHEVDITYSYLKEGRTWYFHLPLLDKYPHIFKRLT